LLFLGDAMTRPHFDGETYEPAPDHARLTSQLDRVLDLMRDGAWRTLSQIQQCCGGSDASVSARLRDLRKDKFGGRVVERRRMAPATAGLFEYRVLPPAPKDRLF